MPVSTAKNHGTQVRGYVVGIAALIVAVAANNATAPHLRANTIWTALPYLVAVALAAWQGFIPGVLTVAAVRYVMPLTGLMVGTTFGSLGWPGLTVLLVTSLLVSQLAEKMRKSEKQLRDQIRENTAELEMLYTKLPAGLCFLDCEFRFRRINEWLAAVNGKPAEAHIGLTVDTILPPPIAAHVQPLFARVLETGEPVHNFEFEAASAVDGAMRWWNINCAPVLTAGGKVSGLQIVVLDVTERYESALALTRANEELRRVNDDLSQFAYIAAHDLQEPLRTVVTFSHLVQRRCTGLDAATDQHLEFIVNAGQRMGQLIADVLAYSSMGIDDNRQPEDVPLQPLVASVCDHTAVVECTDLPTVHGYPRQLQQVFENLIGNAVKYSRPNVPPRVIISATRENHHFWRLTVRDNGQGFKQEYADRIFGIFRRLHGKDVPGSGIGLAICKRVVERHGGRIWAESTPGEGAAFHFTLPGRSD